MIYVYLFVVNSVVITYNAALNRPAYQSSVHINGYGIFPAHYANDGSRNTDYRYSPHCAATEINDNPWWAVDLGHPAAIYRVDLTSSDNPGRTRQLSYRKEDRAMRPIYGCPEKF